MKGFGVTLVALVSAAAGAAAAIYAMKKHEELEQYAKEFAEQKHRFVRHPEPAGYDEVLQIYTRSLLR
mgnify:CR=1 FL=1